MKNDEIICKEKVIEGIKGNLSYEELNDIIQKSYEKYDYYDYDSMANMVLKAINNEIDECYFTTYAILITGALYATPKKFNKKLKSTYSALAYSFDGISFYSGEISDLYYFYNELKHYDHFIKNPNKPFLSNGIERFAEFNHCNLCSGMDIYKCLVIDHKNKKYKCMYIPNPDFKLDINYSIANVKYNFKKFEVELEDGIIDSYMNKLYDKFSYDDSLEF